MAKHIIVITETIHHEFVIEASSQDEAIEIARRRINNELTNRSRTLKLVSILEKES